eukprot:SAG31_NODE_53_length_30139_cov_31.002197_28_plen_69_part_00
MASASTRECSGALVGGKPFRRDCVDDLKVNMLFQLQCFFAVDELPVLLLRVVLRQLLAQLTDITADAA